VIQNKGLVGCCVGVPERGGGIKAKKAGKADQANEQRQQQLRRKAIRETVRRATKGRGNRQGWARDTSVNGDRRRGRTGS